MDVEGIPYVHPSYNHIEFLVGGKLNIALVEQIANQKQVVIKIINDKSDFDRERKFLSILGKSPASDFVVELKDTLEPSHGEPRYGLVEELLGENLSDYLRKRPILEELDRKNLAVSVLNAIAAIHSRRVVYGDLKPYQICFDPRQRGFKVKLVDFDSAFSLDDKSHRLDRFTLLYAAPEVPIRVAQTSFIRSIFLLAS